MERIYFLIVILFMAHCMQAQKVGINTSSPVMPLHVAASNGDLAVIENTNPLSLDLQCGLYFANGINSPNNIKYTGAIKTIGLSGTDARLGLFTYAGQNPSSLIERLSILDNGYVGIGTTNPNYKLDVNGSIRSQNDLQINGTLNPGTPLTVGNNVTIGGNESVNGTVTVSGGKGIVRSVNATQMKIKRVSVGFSGTNIGAGSTITSSNLFFGEDYTSVSVTMGQSYNGTGDWAKVLIVPFNVDIVANTCQFKITNTSSSAIDFAGNWDVVLIGN